MKLIGSGPPEDGCRSEEEDMNVRRGRERERSDGSAESVHVRGLRFDGYLAGKCNVTIGMTVQISQESMGMVRVQDKH